MGDSLNAVNNGAGKVIRGINLGGNHEVRIKFKAKGFNGPEG